MPDAAPITTAVQGCAIRYHANVLLPVAHIRDKYPALLRHIAAFPENHLIAVTGQEIATGLIAWQLVQLYPQYMPVIQNDQTPAITGFHSAGAVNPRNANHPVNKFIFIHAVNR